MQVISGCSLLRLLDTLKGTRTDLLDNRPLRPPIALQGPMGIQGPIVRFPRRRGDLLALATRNQTAQSYWTASPMAAESIARPPYEINPPRKYQNDCLVDLAYQDWQVWALPPFTHHCIVSHASLQGSSRIATPHRILTIEGFLVTERLVATTSIPHSLRVSAMKRYGKDPALSRLPPTAFSGLPVEPLIHLALPPPGSLEITSLLICSRQKHPSNYVCRSAGLTVAVHHYALSTNC